MKFANALRSAQAKPSEAGKPTLLVTSVEEKIQKLTPVSSSTHLPFSPTEMEIANAWLLMEAVRASCLEGELRNHFIFISTIDSNQAWRMRN